MPGAKDTMCEISSLASRKLSKLLGGRVLPRFSAALSFQGCCTLVVLGLPRKVWWEILVIPLVLVFLMPAGPSRAEMWDFKVGIGPVYGSKFSRAEKDGMGFQTYCELGLSDVLSLTAGGGYTQHFVGEGSAYSLTNLGLGVLYNIDVLVVVPFLSLRMGWLHKSLDQGDEVPSLTGLGLSVAIGFDYLLTETFTLGFAAEYHGMLTEMEAFPAYAAFTGRVGFRLPY